jgi:hypothetical protein
MQPAVMVGFGAQLHIIRGPKVEVYNQTWTADHNSNWQTRGAYDASTLDNDFAGEFFGGQNSNWPLGYVNHCPAAFYKGKLYYPAYECSNTTGSLYVGRFDGSGIVVYGGDFDPTEKWHSGRGTELLSPSGGSSDVDIRACELATLVHNGNLFMVGNITLAAAPTLWTGMGWDVNNNGTNSFLYKRYYRSLIITDDGRKIVGPAHTFNPDAFTYADLHVTDAIGYKDDIYFANWVDLCRINSGSGSIDILESTIEAIGIARTAKSFEIFPNRGYNAQGVSQEGDGLYFLVSSGVLKKITPTVQSSGVETVFGFNWINSDVRNGTLSIASGQWARVADNISEPQRSPLLLKYNNELHAFVTTAASGYRHFYCRGNPSGVSNWTEGTSSMPENFTRFDGNMYGFVDETRDRMVVAHVSMGEAGIVGHCGGLRGAGGLTIYEYGPARVWKQIVNGVAGSAPRGLIPYNNVGPALHVPSGSNPTVYKCKDYALVNYTIYDHYARVCDVDIEYSIDNGNTWNTARRFKDYNGALLGSGTINLPTLHDGITYPFYWDYVNDVGFNTARECLLRVTPRLRR